LLTRPETQPRWICTYKWKPAIGPQPNSAFNDFDLDIRNPSTPTWCYERNSSVGCQHFENCRRNLGKRWLADRLFTVTLTNSTGMPGLQITDNLPAGTDANWTIDAAIQPRLVRQRLAKPESRLH
jgi:hypothetical protein